MQNGAAIETGLPAGPAPIRFTWPTTTRSGACPHHDDRHLFEMLVLEGAQAGLSWITILRKRERYREVFDRFDPMKVARYGERRWRRCCPTRVSFATG